MIDIHIHGLQGYDTQTDNPQDILEIATLLGERGITAFLPTLYPAPIESMRRQMAIVKKAIETQKVSPHATQAEIQGLHLEGPFLNPVRAGGLDSRSFLVASEYNLQRLFDGFADIIRIITIAPEIDGAMALISSISDRGIIVSMGHSDASFKEAEEAYNAGAKGITHLFNAMRGIHHREPGLAGFGLIHSGIYIEVIADPFHLHPKTIEMVFKVKPLDRIILISDAVKGTYEASPGGIRDRSGTLLGGSQTLDKSVSRLLDLGLLQQESLIKTVKTNQLAYLR